MNTHLHLIGLKLNMMILALKIENEKHERKLRSHPYRSIPQDIQYNKNRCELIWKWN